MLCMCTPCIYSVFTQDILKGMPLSSDVTILNKYCSVTHAAVTLIPKVKASAGNTKIMASSLGNWVNSRLSCSKTSGYCILQIAYSSAVMWNSVKKHAGFAWWRVKCKMWRGSRRTAAFVSVAGWLQVVAPRGWRWWSWCVGSWTPLLLHLNKRRSQKLLCWCVAMVVATTTPERVMSQWGQCQIWKREKWLPERKITPSREQRWKRTVLFLTQHQ